LGTLDPLTSDTPVILFDGVCNLCNGAVQFVIRRDKKNIFRFASLQSETAEKLLRSLRLRSEQIDSIVLIRQGRVYLESDAVIGIAKELSNGWKVLSWLRILPKVFRDMLYRLIARNRYRLFGKKDACMIPSPELRSKFL
jgi:predicted DCC family thiol-disulfide oxidoreductase YuxK